MVTLRDYTCVTSLLMSLLAIGQLGSRDEPFKRLEFDAVHMGTQFRIVLYTLDEDSANVASKAAFERIAELDAMLSDYRADSELMQLCSKAGGPAVPVSKELFFVLSRSQELAERSEGAFDVTVGPAVRLWRRARRQHKLPDPGRLAQARTLVGYKGLVLARDSGSVTLLKPGMQLDLGGIAKGYAADEALAVLARHGITRALVAASGDIVMGAAPPGAGGWTIGIAPLGQSGKDLVPPPGRKSTVDVGDGQDAKLQYLLLHDCAISTSGDTEQYLEIDGRRYSHIIDPRTSQALTERMHVTVVARDGTTSDSLATAVSVLGPDRGMQFIERTPGTAGMFVRTTIQGQETIESETFRKLRRAEE